MANHHRGEIEAVLDGQTYVLCLTLGALAELESAFKASSLMALADRFEKGQLTSHDIAILISCGLKGGGTDICADVVATMKTENGLNGFIDIATSLLVATFGKAQTSTAGNKTE
ncbi:MAG: gene transfer agent family protein [Hyphomicrobiales bacterium]